MEKYLSLIILAAPGFIAERIANALGVTSPRKLAGYLSYSFFSVLLAIIISALTGTVDLSENWQDFTNKFSSVDFTAKMLLTMLFSAVAVGSSWALVGNKFFMRILNFVNVKTGKNKRNLSGNLLSRIFDDGKEHFIIVRKGGNFFGVRPCR